MMNLLQELNSDGMTIIMVTHNPECAQYARRVLRLSDGLLVEENVLQEADADHGEDQSGKCGPCPGGVRLKDGRIQ